MDVKEAFIVVYINMQQNLELAKAQSIFMMMKPNLKELKVNVVHISKATSIIRKEYLLNSIIQLNMVIVLR